MLDVTDRGLRAWRQRALSQRQRTDMVLLAHICDQHRASLGSYGRPRMTEELTELGFDVGHPLPGSGCRANHESGQVGRLMRQNDIRVVRKRRYKVTTIARQAHGQQVGSGTHFRPSLRSAFAKTMSFRMTAVTATVLGFPA